MEDGVPGAHILNATRFVVEEIRREPDSAITQSLLMAGRSVQALPIRQKNATLNRVQWMEVGGPGVHTLPAASLVVEALRQNLDSATTQRKPMEELIVWDLPGRSVTQMTVLQVNIS